MTTRWTPEYGPLLVMAPEPRVLENWSADRVTRWYGDNVDRIAADGVHIFLDEQDIGPRTRQLLELCDFSGLWLFTDEQRGGPSDVHGDRVRRYLADVLFELGDLDFYLSLTFDWGERDDPDGDAEKFVRLVHDMESTGETRRGEMRRHLAGARQLPGKPPLPGDYATWEDHRPDDGDWRRIFESNRELAAGRPVGSTDRFRHDPADQDPKDLRPGELPAVVAAAWETATCIIVGNLADRPDAHAHGSVKLPIGIANEIRTIRQREPLPTPPTSIPALGEIEPIPPGTPTVFSWPVVSDFSCLPGRSGDLITLQWRTLPEATWPGFSDAGPSDDQHIGNLWMVYYADEDRPVAETVEWLREESGERTGTAFSPREKLTAGWPTDGSPVGFFVAGPSRHEQDEARFRRRTDIRWFRWPDLSRWNDDQELPMPQTPHIHLAHRVFLQRGLRTVLGLPHSKAVEKARELIASGADIEAVDALEAFIADPGGDASREAVVEQIERKQQEAEDFEQRITRRTT